MLIIHEPIEIKDGQTEETVRQRDSQADRQTPTDRKIDNQPEDTVRYYSRFFIQKRKDTERWIDRQIGRQTER